MASATEDELEEIKRYEDFTTVDWIQDSILERNRRIRAGKRRWIEIGQTWIVVSIVGVCIGLNAAIISIVTEWLSDIKMGYCADGWWLNEQFCCWEIEGEDETDACDSWHPWSEVGPARWLIYVMCAASFSFVAAHLVRSLAKYAAGSGISEIKCILAGFTMKRFLGFSTLFIKSLTLVLLSRAGFQSSLAVKIRQVVTAASAAGVAVAFGSPIGGVIFSIEEMSHNFSIKTMWRSFFCALVATFTLSAMNPFRTGKLVLFQVTYDRDWHFFEIIFFVILGIFGGLYGAFVVRFNLQVAAFRRKYLQSHAVAEAVILAVGTAMIGYFNRFLRIDMTESMAILFRECDASTGGGTGDICQTSMQWRLANSLLLATIIRTALVVVSYGCKVPAGIFVPRAAAALSGVMRITVTVVVIMFELTGALTYILPTMIVLLVTKAVGDFLGTNGIADEMIKFNGFPFLEKEDHAYGVDVSVVMRTDLYTVPEKGLRVKDVESLISSTDVKGFPVVSGTTSGSASSLSSSWSEAVAGTEEDGNLDGGKPTLLGYIGKTELKFVLEKFRKTAGHLDPEIPCLFGPPLPPPPPSAPVSASRPTRLASNRVDELVQGIEEEEIPETMFERPDGSEGMEIWPWVNQTPMTVSPQLPLEIVMQLFKRMGPRVILVEDHGSLVGLVTVKDVLRFIAMEKPGYHHPSWDERGGLDGLLEELWSVIRGVVDRLSVFYFNSFTRQHRQATSKSKPQASEAARKTNFFLHIALPQFSCMIMLALLYPFGFYFLVHQNLT
ncbi:Cl-channel protein [Lentinula edodes]|uniref:Chloride channel protein n=1 Tax=Lentinula edodes TaxID=5353 RepID=A0A1Q3E0Y2_LENED|nr:Cl-channel protein [Lentinula edodes]